MPMLRAYERLFESGESGAFNLGTGRGYSVKEVLDQIESVTGKRFEVEQGPRRPGDPPT